MPRVMTAKGATHHPPRSDGPPRLGWLLTGLLAAVPACASPAPPVLVVHDSLRAHVSLERLSSSSLQAAHPASIPPSTLTHFFAGIRVGTQQRFLQRILTGEAAAEMAFAADEAAPLARYVAAALERAGPNDVVRFAVQRATERGKEETGGTLYVENGTVVLTLTHFRTHPAETVGVGRARGAPYASGLQRRTVSFLPAGVEVPLPGAPPAELASRDFKTLAIDYLVLAKLTRLGAPPGRSAPHTGERSAPGGEEQAPSGEGAAEGRASPDVQTLKELVIRKDVEIDALRKEVESLHRQLEQRQPDE